MGFTNCWYNTGYENLNTPSRQGLLSPLHEPIKAAWISTLLLFSTHGTYIAGWCSTPNQLLIFPKCLSFAYLLITKHSPDIYIYILYTHIIITYAGIGIDKYIKYSKYICLNINAVCLYEEPNLQGGYLFFYWYLESKLPTTQQPYILDLPYPTKSQSTPKLLLIKYIYTVNLGNPNLNLYLPRLLR